MISTGYNQIKWGILISIIHIYISTELGGFEIVPAFIGYFLIMRGTSAICSETNLEYMNSLKAESLRLFILSCVYWITGIFFGYGLAIQKLILIVFYLFDVLFFGNLLNKTVKYLKESMRLDDADKLRKNRMTFIKCYLALIIFSVIAMIPNAMGFFVEPVMARFSSFARLITVIILSLGMKIPSMLGCEFGTGVTS